jgi:ceramide synthetase
LQLGRWLPTALFVVFMLSWFTSRIYYFPAHVIRSVYYEPINVRARLLLPDQDTVHTHVHL